MSSNERKVRNLQKKYAKEDKNAVEAGLSLLTGNADGRRFLWLFLEECKAFVNPFERNALDMSFNCGVQSAGQRLLAQITEIDPDAFLVMMKENQNVRKSRSTAFGRTQSDAESEPGAYAGDDGASRNAS
jgi:hypothetical protein